MTSDIEAGGSHVLGPRFRKHSKGFLVGRLVGWLAVCRYEVKSEGTKVLKPYRMTGKATQRSRPVIPHLEGICHRAENLGLTEKAEHLPVSSGSAPSSEMDRGHWPGWVGKKNSC